MRLLCCEITLVHLLLSREDIRYKKDEPAYVRARPKLKLNRPCITTWTFRYIEFATLQWKNHQSSYNSPDADFRL